MVEDVNLLPKLKVTAYNISILSIECLMYGHPFGHAFDEWAYF